MPVEINQKHKKEGEAIKLVCFIWKLQKKFFVIKVIFTFLRLSFVSRMKKNILFYLHIGSPGQFQRKFMHPVPGPNYRLNCLL